VTCYEVEQDVGLYGRVPIGKPISNCSVFIVDAKLKLVPIGCIGEICVGGLNVAAGYWESPELSSARFVDDPFGGSGKLFRTGDRGRFMGDGTVQFIGRVDRQVKL
jgi:non-ribosomal peptide synthetase component F